jgi:DeoR family transcriptional regulator of aga operon
MGIDPKRGMSEIDVPQASIKLRMIEAAGQTILLADASKFGISSRVFTAPATAVDTLITNPTLLPGPRGVIEALRAEGLEVLEVEETSDDDQ